IDDPYKIDQQGSSLCAPAAMVFALAKDSPERYAKFVIDLFELGAAKLGKLDIRPGEDLLTYGLPASDRGPDAVDWIALASLRDSSNWILDYQAATDSVAGITTPGTLAQWARDIGYTKVIDKTILIDDRGKNLWEAAVRNEVNRYKVFLLINGRLL